MQSFPWPRLHCFRARLRDSACQSGCQHAVAGVRPPTRPRAVTQRRFCMRHISARTRAGQMSRPPSGCPRAPVSARSTDGAGGAVVVHRRHARPHAGASFVARESSKVAGPRAPDLDGDTSKFSGVAVAYIEMPNRASAVEPNGAPHISQATFHTGDFHRASTWLTARP